MRFLIFFFVTFLSLPVMKAQEPAVIGRWDLTFDVNGTERPGWLEISKSGNSILVGRTMIFGGSARPISEIEMENDRYTFTIPVQWDRGDDQVLSFTVGNDMLTGTMRHSNGKSHPWTGVRAPLLTREKEPEWGEPITLFNGKNLNGWITQNPNDRNQWVAEDGLLKNPKSGANLRTADNFNDFKLHIEFRYPAGSNSGIYLRGRYEVQIEDNKGREPEAHLFGGVYGILHPNAMVAKDPGEWQSFDITLVGRMITVVANGVTVICDQLIPGITGGALDSHEGEPGPILLQGDHGPIEFRNIVLTPARM